MPGKGAKRRELKATKIPGINRLESGPKLSNSRRLELIQWPVFCMGHCASFLLMAPGTLPILQAKRSLRSPWLLKAAVRMEDPQTVYLDI